jgi:hypothetical protein
LPIACNANLAKFGLLLLQAKYEIFKLLKSVYIFGYPLEDLAKFGLLLLLQAKYENFKTFKIFLYFWLPT